MDTGEECDDGNLGDGDGCSAACATEVAPDAGTPAGDGGMLGGDAGAPSADAGGAGSDGGGSGGDAGGGGTSGGGCSCRASGSEGGSGRAAWLLALGLAVVVRRRRR